MFDIRGTLYNCSIYNSIIIVSKEKLKVNQSKIDVDIYLKKMKMLEISIFLWKQVKLEGDSQHAVITNANWSNDMKISTFLGKKTAK